MQRVFKFGGGEVRLDLPADWGDACDEQAISFSSPSGEAALTITVHDEPRLSPDDIDRLNAENRPFGISCSAKRPLPLRNGSGYAREYEKEVDGRRTRWLAYFLFFDHVTVIASVNGPLDEMRDHRVTFEAILRTIEVTAPDAAQR